MSRLATYCISLSFNVHVKPSPMSVQSSGDREIAENTLPTFGILYVESLNTLKGVEAEVLDEELF